MDHFPGDDIENVFRWGRQIHRLNCCKDRILERHLEPYDITAAQFKVLLLMKREGLTTSAELCRFIVLDSGAMSRMLDRLENKKMIKRVRCTTDRRQFYLELTAQGQEFCRQIPLIAVKAFNDLLQPFTPAEFNEFDRMLTKLLVHAGF